MELLIAFCIIVLHVTTYSIDSVYGQYPSNFGGCPDMKPIQNFDLKKFQGPWFEVERSFYFYELFAFCPRFNFSLIPNTDDKLKVIFSMKNRISSNTNNYEGLAVVRSNPAVWDYRVNANLPSFINRIMPGSGTYMVLDTDYENFAILYSCSNLGLFHTDLIWVLGRRLDLGAERRIIIYNSLSNHKIDEDRYVDIAVNAIQAFSDSAVILISINYNNLPFLYNEELDCILTTDYNYYVWGNDTSIK